MLSLLLPFRSLEHRRITPPPSGFPIPPLSDTMAPWTERLKAKLGRKNPLTYSLSKASSTSTIPHGSTVLDPTASSPSLPERLWNQSYDQAKASDSSIVDTYETILSTRLSQKDADPTDLASQQNKIEQNPEKRWIQMRQLVQDGLHRTEKEANMKQGMEDGIQAAMAVKAVVDKAMQTAPEAALAWVGGCFALEVGPAVTKTSIWR